MSLAENLLKWRLARYLTQSDLAAKAGVHKMTVLRIERGGYIPQLRTITQLAEALSVKPEELITAEELVEAKRAA